MVSGSGSRTLPPAPLRRKRSPARFVHAWKEDGPGAPSVLARERGCRRVSAVVDPREDEKRGAAEAAAQEITHGMTIQSGGFWSYYYTAAGIHATHVLAGMVIMVFIAMAALKNRDLHRVELVGIYWHFVDIVWIFLFPLLYIAK